MRLKIATAAAALICAPAFACDRGSGDVFTLESFGAQSDATTGVPAIRLTMLLRSGLDRDVRMVEGHVIFVDVLGRSIGRVAIDADASVSAQGLYEQSRRYSSFGDGFNRLPAIDPADVVTTVCVEAVVYGDGERDFF